MDSEEYKLKKEEVTEKLHSLMVAYDELMKMTSPQHWRGSGHYTMELQKMEKELHYLKEITKDELDMDWVQQALKQV